MATIFRALVTAALLLFGYVVWTGAGSDEAWHLRVGLVASLFAGLVQSIPFAYFLGTGFWIKAFVRAAAAGPEWELRHKQWMKGRAYPFMYMAPLLTMAAAISGGLAGTGRVPVGLHLALVVLAIVAAAVALVLVPPVMRRNSALMDELADTHAPRTAEEQIADEEPHSLPPLFQLSRILMYAGVQLLIIWLYLRFGTEGWRDTPLLPFGAAFVVLLTLGLGLNARHDPDRPRSPAAAWTRAVTLGAACTAALVLVL